MTDISYKLREQARAALIGSLKSMVTSGDSALSEIGSFGYDVDEARGALDSLERLLQCEQSHGSAVDERLKLLGDLSDGIDTLDTALRAVVTLARTTQLALLALYSDETKSRQISLGVKEDDVPF